MDKCDYKVNQISTRSFLVLLLLSFKAVGFGISSLSSHFKYILINAINIISNLLCVEVKV